MTLDYATCSGVCTFIPHFQFTFSATHIQEVQNIAADALSRHNLTLSYFLSTAAATHSSFITGQSVIRTTPGLELHGLDETVCSLLAASLAPSTMRTYHSGLSRFLLFCQHKQLPSFPLSKSTLCRFVAYLFNQSISSSSIRLYLSALHFFQIEQGGQDTSMSVMPRLCYVLCSTARQQATCVHQPGCLLLLTSYTSCLWCGLEHHLSRRQPCYGRHVPLGFLGFYELVK